MNRQQLTDDLLAAPLRVYEAEGNLHAAKLQVATERDAYADAEASLTLGRDALGDPLVNGKNAEQRAAQLRLALSERLFAVRSAEAACLAFERDYNLAINHARALRSVAALLAGANEERIAA